MRREEVFELARILFEHHGLDLPDVTGHAWTFRLDNAKSRAGVCKFGTKTISISWPYASMNTIDEVSDTILHEVAHALCGANAGHGPEWKACARRIGATPERCVTDAAVRPEPHYIGICGHCGHVAGKVHRITKQRRSMACKRCCDAYNGGRYSAEYMIAWETNPAWENYGRKVLTD